MKKTLLVALFLFANTSTYALECRPKAAALCENGTCKNYVPDRKFRIEAGSDTLRRCDSKGCDKYAVSPIRSGAFHVYSVANAGYFIKIGLDNSFAEVASVGLAILYQSGTCSPSR